MLRKSPEGGMWPTTSKPRTNFLRKMAVRLIPESTEGGDTEERPHASDMLASAVTTATDHVVASWGHGLHLEVGEVHPALKS